MIKKLTRLLGNIVGRIKKDMGAYYLTVGAIFTPTGFIILLETHNRGLAGIAFLLGTIALFFGIRTIQRDDKIAFNRWELQTTILVGILDELKKLRGDKNGHTDTDNRE